MRLESKVLRGETWAGYGWPRERTPIVELRARRGTKEQPRIVSFPSSEAPGSQLQGRDWVWGRR